MLTLNFYRLLSNRNCCFWFYKHKEEADATNDEISINNHQLKDQLNKKNNFVSFITEKKISMIKMSHWLFSNVSMFCIFFMFILYFIMNSSICYRYINFDLPMTDLVPAQSYLSKHLKIHETLFNLGPLIMIIFTKPLNYATEENQKRILTFIKEIQNLDGLITYFFLLFTLI
jgi:hypothetical protein